ncbi:MAG: MarR family winged helix-turn-helix transcriptional regulator [Eubacteriales bacterium]|nr:MarR family winged helix-turn-helix transcriptional regulator [Eubacteriales bacterium]
MGEIQYSKEILGLANQIRRLYNASTGNNGAQIRILSFVLENYTERDIFQKDVEEELNVRSAGTSTILKKLEEQEMIVREKVPYDDRLKRIRPTRRAIEKKDSVDRDIRLVENRLISGISGDELDNFFEVTQKMIKNMNGIRGGKRHGSQCKN